VLKILGLFLILSPFIFLGTLTYFSGDFKQFVFSMFFAVILTTAVVIGVYLLCGG
jgi:hypothetical protein